MESFKKGMELAKSGQIHLQKQELNQAIQKTMEAIECFNESEQKQFLGKAFRQLADAYKQQQNWVGCLAGYQESINWDVEAGNIEGVIISQLHVFRLLLQLGQFEKANKSLDDAESNLKQNPTLPKYEQFENYISGLKKELKTKGV
jgi:tetratricopeptide (TPR) repeat protein